MNEEKYTRISDIVREKERCEELKKFSMLNTKGIAITISCYDSGIAMLDAKKDAVLIRELLKVIRDNMEVKIEQCKRELEKL